MTDFFITNAQATLEITGFVLVMVCGTIALAVYLLIILEMDISYTINFKNLNKLYNITIICVSVTSLGTLLVLVNKVVIESFMASILTACFMLLLSFIIIYPYAQVQKTKLNKRLNNVAENIVHIDELSYVQNRLMRISIASSLLGTVAVLFLCRSVFM